jgi:hypothetical protein
MRLHQAGTEGSASKDHEALEQKRVRDSQRIPPDRQSVQQFDELLREGGFAQTETSADSEQASGEASEETAKGKTGSKHAPGKKPNLFDEFPNELPPALLAQLIQSNPQLQQAQMAQAAYQSGTSKANEVMSLLRKHVRQLAMSSDARETGASGKAWLRLNDALLPGTDILLERDQAGWHLKARTDSQDSYALMQDCADALQTHFVDAGLGAISLQCELQT